MKRISVLAALLALSCAAGEVTPPRPGPAQAPAAPPALPAPPAADAAAAQRFAYPESRRVDVKDVLHGVVVEDPYRWLEDGKAADVLAWSKAQDDFARRELGKLPGRDRLAARLKELFYIDSIEVPAHRGNRYFYARRYTTKEKAVIHWKEGKSGEEKVLFDPNTWSQDGSVSLGRWSVTWDGKKVAYQVKKNNSDAADRTGGSSSARR